jgi:hypothetical protein
LKQGLVDRRRHVDALFAGSTELIESFGHAADGKRVTDSVVDGLSGRGVVVPHQGTVPSAP